jgi:nucleoid-associated protein YgaU
MSPRSRAAFLALPLLLVLSGCGYVHVGKLPEPATTVIGDDKLMKENSDLRLEKKMLQQELALSRAQGDALRMAIENRAADGDTSRRLVEKLNETTKELAALRANYAQLQSERTSSPSATAENAALRSRLGETEEKLAASLRNYTQLQDEIGRLKAEVDRTRDENLTLTAQVKTITAQNEQAQAALAQLNTDLLAQKDARLRAEQDAETLRTALRSADPNSSALGQLRTGSAADARSLVAEQAAESATLKQQLSGLQARVDALSTERTELLRQLEARPPAADLANLEARLASAVKTEASLREENLQLKAVRSELAQQLAQARSAPAGAVGQDIQEQLRQAQAQATALADENARLKARLAGGSETAAKPVVVPAAITVTPNANGVAVRPSGVSATLVAAVPSAQRPETPKPDAAAPSRLHVVTSGDTLAKISTLYYGTPARWGDILAANRDVLGESNNLVIGRTLRIP